MLHRMVDDITIKACIMKPGTRYESDQLVIYDDKILEDKLVPDDLRTSRVIQNIALLKMKQSR